MQTLTGHVQRPPGVTGGPTTPAEATEGQMSRGGRKSIEVEPLQVPAPVAARLAGVSTATWYRLHAAGRTPAPTRLGGRVLWRRDDLELWVRLGCPDRKRFEALRAANGNGKP
jgi:predicted DNA-binding transcriptional regulator AlpA